MAHYFYQDEKDKSKSGKAYFYYDDESIQDRFGTLPEGEYYLKINEIAKDTKPSFLKDYPFEIGKTWGRYCVRLYTDKECSKTFKEIEIKESDKTLNWSYVECNSEKKMRYLLDTDCHSIEAKDLKFIDSFKGNICGFHLPISRDNEPIKDTKDYKYYIIVFAYDEKKVMPSLEDFHIVIDMSFRVGVGRDESVEEGKLRNDFNSDIIQTNCIFSVFEAVEFLKACQSLKEEKNEIDNYVFFKNYPQLAGKIAYIYYRFDLANEEFIKSVSDGNKYLKEREKFYKVASDVYIKNPIYKMGFEKKLQNQVVDINIVKDFLKDFAKRLGIDEKVLPVIGYNPQRGDSGTYDYTVNTLDLNPKASCVDFIDTIIHEFRHFYIYCIKNNSENSIEKLLYLDMVQFYISWNFYKIFNSYDKKCLIYDNEDETKKCLKNRTYYGSWKFLNPKLDLLPSPLYYLQPSELDSRIMAYYFRKEIKL
ncbi:hypothetical protein [Campylobacter coli]|uniref:hypothetical protein n=1 Tax=Campylobacter coli TaxID=195 RepID=UPI001CB780B8|nr:hypothetical protein [Campylobacter coli]